MKTANTSKTNNQTATEYIAPELKNFTVLGVPFQAFIDENGKKVFSEAGVERGLGVTQGHLKHLRKYGHLDPQTKTPRIGNAVTARVTAVQTKNPRNGNARTERPARYLKVEGGRKLIRVITPAELLCAVSYFAERGNARAIAMQEAGFALALQQTIDEYDGIQRTHKEYLEPAAALREAVEYRRNKLRRTTGALTTPLLHCNVFKPNNDFIFGDGLTRDTYQGEDKEHLLYLMESLELVQSGLKMADLTLAEVIAISHSRIRPLLKNNKARIKGNK